VALQVVYLVRHGKAEAAGAGGDRQRALSSEGRRRIAELVPQASSRGMAVDLALSSPYLRALQTRDLFLPALGNPRVENSTVLTPESDPGDAVDELLSWEAGGVKSAAVFTHNPFVSGLADLLLAPGAWPDRVFHTPTILALGFDAGLAPPRTGKVLWVLHP
jgi:phosphohistidine phosphatase